MFTIVFVIGQSKQLKKSILIYSHANIWKYTSRDTLGGKYSLFQLLF